MPWNPAVLEQRIGRIYRLGQTKPIDVFNLVSEPGIESRIAGLVGSKQAFFKGLFDGETDAVQFEEVGSFLSRVEKITEPAMRIEAMPSTAGDELPDLDLDLDDEVDEPLEQLLDDADESRDAAAPEAVPSPVPEPEPEHVAPMPGLGDVRQIFSRLAVRREGDGRVIIEAPAEDAHALGALFEGMAALLRSIAIPGALPGTSVDDGRRSPP